MQFTKYVKSNAQNDFDTILQIGIHTQQLRTSSCHEAGPLSSTEGLHRRAIRC